MVREERFPVKTISTMKTFWTTTGKTPKLWV